MCGIRVEFAPEVLTHRCISTDAPGSPQLGHIKGTSSACHDRPVCVVTHRHPPQTVGASSRRRDPSLRHVGSPRRRRPALRVLLCGPVQETPPAGPRRVAGGQAAAQQGERRRNVALHLRLREARTAPLHASRPRRPLPLVQSTIISNLYKELVEKKLAKLKEVEAFESTGAGGLDEGARAAELAAIAASKAAGKRYAGDAAAAIGACGRWGGLRVGPKRQLPPKRRPHPTHRLRAHATPAPFSRPTYPTLPLPNRQPTHSLPPHTPHVPHRPHASSASSPPRARPDPVPLSHTPNLQA